MVLLKQLVFHGLKGWRSSKSKLLAGDLVLQAVSVAFARSRLRGSGGHVPGLLVRTMFILLKTSRSMKIR